MITVPFGLTSLLFVTMCSAAPALLAASSTTQANMTVNATQTISTADATATVPFISTDLNEVLWNSSDAQPDPQAIRGSLGATILGPTDDFITVENADLLAPPTTDNGFTQNAKWPFSLSKNRLQTGGWSRQENVNVMPFATKMAGVNMRLTAGSIRELHWHTTAEWAYVIKGTTQVTAVDTNGRNFIGTVEAGDLWYFPPGIPHSLQATADDPDGSEFLLIFPDGDFSDDSTFLLTDWMSHVPVDVLTKNFQSSPAAFAHIPAEQLYIFPGTPPADGNSSLPVSPNGLVENSLSFAFSKVAPTQLNGGTVKIVDSRSFPVSTAIAAADIFLEPGAIRELHWHPTQDEWGFFMAGEGRVTIFASQSISGTFNYVAGDIAYIPAGMGHYVENTGNTTLHFLEIFNTDKFEDISLSTWLALTPVDLVKAHLGFDDETISHLFKTEQTIIGPA
ncbi:hypothetical protein HYPSUDRAFT_44387 [Hypholoma sublateritium FD-334 SS-4]|uniref:Cupin type-1 domain-containing protein n=1 Tax=Hypholoma sublateritium (strain FD-334 SS-4) TaxID=945553 RepID=A0A0D2NRL2_HYPSF|nr:hypothetical protein HYPSUDRAFT_44387 [Hypholoma sublateritium FD-334 SS-4]